MQIAPQWMKLDTNVFSHKKIRKIRRMPDGDSLFTLWIYMMCEGMKNITNPGAIELCAGVPASDNDIADDVGIKISTVQLGLETFARLGMVLPNENGCIEVKNLAKHQSLDKLAYKREQNRLRQEKYRKSNNLSIEDKTKDVTRYECVSNALEEKRVEESREDKKRVDNKKVVFPESLNNDEFKKLWSEWETHRKEIKTKLTPLAAKKQLDMLKDYPLDVCEKIINKSINGGWKGLFPLDEKKGGLKTPNNDLSDWEVK